MRARRPRSQGQRTTAVTVDGKYRTSLLVDPPNGRFPPLTERGKARREGLYGFSKRNTGPAWWRDRKVGPYDDPESLSIADQHVVEHFTFQDENTLLYRFTLESGDWEAPYSGEYTWPATDGKLYEFACHEGNYATGNTLRGARFEEREVEAQTGG